MFEDLTISKKSDNISATRLTDEVGNGAHTYEE